uniref:Transposase n=1 Tax=Myoviridae sp. ctWb16 TaxID=2827690 RepID=A0A8S5T1D4_9CAUD|nr:MAG TPA: hypothetical protein [Myoviridae sp. ctWb16]
MKQKQKASYNGAFLFYLDVINIHIHIKLRKYNG